MTGIIYEKFQREDDVTSGTPQAYRENHAGSTNTSLTRQKGYCIIKGEIFE